MARSLVRINTSSKKSAWKSNEFHSHFCLSCKNLMFLVTSTIHPLFIFPVPYQTIISMLLTLLYLSINSCSDFHFHTKNHLLTIYFPLPTESYLALSAWYICPTPVFLLPRLPLHPMRPVFPQRRTLQRLMKDICQ